MKEFVEIRYRTFSFEEVIQIFGAFQDHNDLLFKWSYIGICPIKYKDIMEEMFEDNSRTKAILYSMHPDENVRRCSKLLIHQPQSITFTWGGEMYG